MALTILDDSMSSDRSSHTARLAPGEKHVWEVSWLPGRRLNRNEAITAMVLADVNGPGDMHARHQNWVHYKGWSAELGMSAAQVLDRVAGPPWAQPEEKTGTPADPEAGG